MLTRRHRMVDEQLRRRGVRNERILEAMMSVPRERFVLPDMRETAYEDRALPVGEGQTISQPYMVAHMTELLDPTHDCTVLEIGTGTGYQTAILAHLAGFVHSVERRSTLARDAAERLSELGYTNVSLTVGDGSLGLTKHAPYDRILVTAGSPGVPNALRGQLADGGVMVLPVGGKEEQVLIRVCRQGDQYVETASTGCRFVKLIGKQGWEPTG